MPNKAIIVRPDYTHTDPNSGENHGILPVFRVLVSGPFKSGTHVTLEIVEVDQSVYADQHKTEAVIGRIGGKLSGTSLFRENHTYEIHPDGDVADVLAGNICVGFILKGSKPLVFDLPLRKSDHTSGGDGKHYWFEGDYWEIKLRIPELEVESPVFPVAWQTRAVPALFTEDKHRQGTYDWHFGNDLEFYTDASNAADGGSGAFYNIARAIEAARSFIFIVDWSFHPTIFLDPVDSNAAPVDATNADDSIASYADRELKNTLGAKLLCKANDGVLVAIHTWYHDTNVAEHPNEDAYPIMMAMANRLGIPKPPNLLWRGSARFPTSWYTKAFPVFWSHHQKFIVLDSPVKGGRSEIRTFFGGLDMTKGRYDWHEHPLFADEDVCARFRHPITKDGKTFLFNLKKQTHHYDDWYNAEHGAYPELEALADDNAANLNPRQPWHDIHASITGPLAWDFVREFVGRWVCRTQIKHEYGSATLVWQKFQELMDRDKFVPQWEPRATPGKWTAQLLHSIVKGHINEAQDNPDWNPNRKEFDWSLDGDFEKSIQESYLRAIGQAERFIHIENQYFIGSGKKWNYFGFADNKIPEALVNRILHKAKQKQKFHVYIVIPMVPEGGTVSTASDVWNPKRLAGMVSNHGVRSLEWQTMAWMINELKNNGLRWQDYLSFYWLAGSEGTEKRITAFGENHRSGATPTTLQDQMDQRRVLANTNRRGMIYVHCKMMIVDDRFVILGSANINERSMGGDRDTEIAVALWPSTNRVEASCEADVRNQLRFPLWTEHLGALPAGAELPESEATRDAFQSTAQDNFWNLWMAKKVTGKAMMAPFDTDGDSWALPSWLATRISDSHAFSELSMSEDPRYILDALWQASFDDQVAWSWECYTPAVYGRRPASYLVE